MNKFLKEEMEKETSVFLYIKWNSFITPTHALTLLCLPERQVTQILAFDETWVTCCLILMELG
jgi:hypothetical protein